ncbi:MAG: tetratricopeptide repeat protein, partial [Longimicrobiaceae bacterium]
YHQLGMVEQDRGELDAAEQWYRRSLEINEALGDRPGMATSSHPLSIVKQLRGELDAAAQWYRRSLEINEALGNRPGMAASYGQLGVLFRERDDYANALAHSLNALLIYLDLGLPQASIVFRHLNTLFCMVAREQFIELWRGIEAPEGLLDQLLPQFRCEESVDDDAAAVESATPVGGVADTDATGPEERASAVEDPPEETVEGTD